jgi:3-phenylpropionate/trans-cinnamate dioxygenase ferredoxin subunit
VTVGRTDEIGPGARKLISVDGRSLCIFNIKGAYYVYLNICPHAFGPVCVGRVRGTTLPSPPGEYRWGREGEILACPWHGWEYDLLTGECLTDKRKLYAFEVTIEDGDIIVVV